MPLIRQLKQTAIDCHDLQVVGKRFRDNGQDLRYQRGIIDAEGITRLLDLIPSFHLRPVQGRTRSNGIPVTINIESLMGFLGTLAPQLKLADAPSGANRRTLLPLFLL